MPLKAENLGGSGSGACAAPAAAWVSRHRAQGRRAHTCGWSGGGGGCGRGLELRLGLYVVQGRRKVHLAVGLRESGASAPTG